MTVTHFILLKDHTSLSHPFRLEKKLWLMNPVTVDWDFVVSKAFRVDLWSNKSLLLSLNFVFKVKKIDFWDSYGCHDDLRRDSLSLNRYQQLIVLRAILNVIVFVHVEFPRIFRISQTRCIDAVYCRTQTNIWGRTFLSWIKHFLLPLSFQTWN